MTPRLQYAVLSAEFFKKFAGFSRALNESAIEARLRHLVEIRVSQLNACGLCVDMRVKQATIHGERPLRLHHLVVWRESPLFSPRERAGAGDGARLGLAPAGLRRRNRRRSAGRHR